LLEYASMRLVSVAVLVTLLSGCNHTGGFGRGFGSAASGLARTAAHAASDVGRFAAPIATRVARVAPVVARDAIVVAATTVRLAEIGVAVSEAGAAAAAGEPDAGAGEPRIAAGAMTPDVSSNNNNGADPCSECPSDETCFYIEYMCPATTGPAPIGAAE
jgi:predicted small secreted protein